MTRRSSGWTTWNQLRRSTYFTQRTMGDVNAARRGRLGKRIARRTLTRLIFRGLGL